MKLICAVDLDEGAEKVVAEASRWAERLGATLDLLYVDGHNLGSRFVFDSAVAQLMEKEYTRLREKDYRRLEQLRGHIAKAHQGTVFVEQGPPAQVVLAKAQGYDALLVATSGRTGLSHFWLGSVAERIIRTSPVPVIVLRVGEVGG